ncbi:MAG: hypothetical protein K8T26_16050 [Lentisphaerae bacterium]|nr:hypothetical protein [Lentisphaerota bacterium]
MTRIRRAGMLLVLLGSVALPAEAESRSLADIRAGRRVTDADPAVVEAEAGAGAGAGAAGAAEKSDANVPAGWLRGVGPSGYEKALELQQATGMDMLIYFFREDPKDEKGLCHWFEKKGLNESHVLKQMRTYIKVRIDAAQNDARTRGLIDEYHCGKTPRLVVRRPDGHTKRVEVFDWPSGGGQPILVPPSDLVTRFQEASSPRVGPPAKP